MKVSIITVTYNSAATFEETVLSVIAQTYRDIEYIVVDGGSTDGTLDIINKYKHRIAMSVSEKDDGLYDALNKGIKLASGDIIGILHSDDFYCDNSVIGNYVEVFEKSGADAVYANLYYVHRQNTAKIIRKWRSGVYTRQAFKLGWMPPHPTFFVKKHCYTTYGLFDTSFRTAADYELMLRFIEKHHIKLSYLNKFTVYMRTGGTSNKALSNRIRANNEDTRAWKKNGLRPLIITRWLKPLRKLIQFF